MPPTRNTRPGYVVVFPNRDKAASKAIRWVVIALLIVSAVLIVVVTLGGWSKLQGLKLVNLLWAILYLVAAYAVFRWKRGALAFVAAMAILLLILAVIAGTGISGTSWFDRSHTGYASAQSLFGGAGFTADTLGFMTVLIIPLEALLVFFSIQGFSQGWNVETEVPEDEAKRSGSSGSSASPEPATA